MRHRTARRSPRTNQQGYALLLVMFLLALVVVASVAVVPNIITNAQREKEKELIWRGNQYAHGVKLYYRRNGRFPASLEDLTKPKVGVRFMRQEYKDPMNTVDGSWRFIYVGPSGQLIGSLKNRSINLSGQPMANPAGSSSQSSFGSSAFGNPSSNMSNSGFGASSFGSSTTNSTPQNPQANPQQNPDNPDASADQTSNPQSLDGSDSPTIVGGNIIGVGSKVNKKSIIWYDQAKNYRQFEFIWDPSKNQITGVSPGSGLQFGNSNQSAPGVPINNQMNQQSPAPQPMNPPPNPDPGQPNPPQQ
jgi:type II secretory pathway pseudopilin PulG